MSLATRDCKESEASISCRPFEFQEIVRATQNFSKSLEIGSGGYGKVYKGKITHGATSYVVAIKRLHPESIQESHEFLTEVETLSKLRHSNLVPLIGYCDHDEEKILVYEYMPNGSIFDHLHKHETPLTWLQRLKICIGAARGLNYLHHGTRIIHRDIRSANILLNESWEAKISDFGLSKICSRNEASTYVNTCVIDNFGYYDPLYFETGKLSKKSDVYSFGVVLLEILTGKLVLGETLYGEGRNLVSWAKISIKARKSRNIVDSHLSNEIHSKSLKEFISIAYRCLHEELGSRPTMAEVVARLEYLRTEKLGGPSELQLASYKTKIFYRMVHMLLFFCNRGKFGVTKLSSNSNNKIVSGTICAYNSSFPSPSLKEFVLDDLKRATRLFSSNLLVGQGGFGKVYLGWVDQDTLAPSEHGDGIAIVVKRLDLISTHEYDEWQAEMNLLGHVAHPNIISLLGYCADGPERFLVYKYMPNKSLNYFLFTDGFEVPLSWGTRLMIMIGVARGLTYLHSRNIIYRDMKSSNILLDEAFNAKLAGFGLARYGPETGETHVSTLVKGTIGYIDPHYFQTGRLTVKCDLYSFGVVLLEVLTGRKSIYDQQYEEGQSLVQWATKIKRRNLKKIVDMRLVDNYPLKAASKCFVLALRCVKENPDDRPSSEEVLQRLEQIKCIP